MSGVTETRSNESPVQEPLEHNYQNHDFCRLSKISILISLGNKTLPNDGSGVQWNTDDIDTHPEEARDAKLDMLLGIAPNGRP